MKTGLKKKQKETTIEFDEDSPNISVRTFNTALKNRLNELAKGYPDCCQVLDVDPETDCTEFSVQKGRLCFRVTKPYTEERKKLLSDYARQHGIQEYSQKL